MVVKQTHEDSKGPQVESILIIDDDETVLRLLEDALTHKRYAVSTANTGIMGLALAREVQPALILCDIGLPDVDGYNVLMQLRSDATTTLIPIVFLTASTDRESMRRAMALGAEDFLTKPFTMRELHEVVRTQLNKQQARRHRFEATLAELRDNISTALPHEIRTSIMVVQGYTDLLMADHSPDSTTYEMLQTISRHTERMSRLAEKFLWYVRSNWPLSAREITLVTPFAGELLCNIAAETASRMGREDDLRLAVDDQSVKAPSEHLERLYIEVIDNAFKFSAPGTQVTIRAGCEAGRYHIGIHDTGRGMAPEQIASMGAFMQFERQQYEQQGTGLGLIIASQLVANVGGDFMLASDGPGLGTQVDIWLPTA